MIYITYFFAALTVLFGTPTNDDLEVIIENVTPSSGAIYLSVYDNAETFCSEETFFFADVYPVTSNNTLSISIPNLPHGTYAIAIYQDVNDNKVMDKNMMGVPKEPFAFSSGATAKWSEPEFKDAHFEFNANSQPQKIVLKYWKDQ